MFDKYKQFRQKLNDQVEAGKAQAELEKELKEKMKAGMTKEELKELPLISKYQNILLFDIWKDMEVTMTMIDAAVEQGYEIKTSFTLPIMGKLTTIEQHPFILLQRPNPST